MQISTLTRKSGALASLVALSVAACVWGDAASAASRPALQSKEQAPVFSRPIMAVVSIRDQRISLYDENGVALRARVSSGQSGLDTPSGVFAVLQKNADHVSNVYEGAAMPYMQRLTWTGIALHAGALPGYPASHGCVRLPYRFAEDIFSLTKLGMRVVISPNEFAPVIVSHPALFTPSPAIAPAVATAIAFQPDERPLALGNNPYQPVLSKWPDRETQMEALKRIAGEKAIKAANAANRAVELKRILDQRTLEKTKAEKVLRQAVLAKRDADDRIARAEKALQTAQIPRDVRKETAAKAKALDATKDAADKLAKAEAALAVAERLLADEKQNLDVAAPKSPYEAKVKAAIKSLTSDANKARSAVKSAAQTKKNANNRLAQSEQALFTASIPRPTKREEDQRAKALGVGAAANEKQSAAAKQMDTIRAQFDTAQNEFNIADANSTGAAFDAREAMRRTLPASILVSLKDKRLYLRQGHEAVLDVPVEIKNPEKPIGTYVFTAVDFDGHAQDLRWTAVSVGRNANGTNYDRKRNYNIPLTNVAAASGALDRIAIPDEVRKRVAGYVWPGSSFVVTDESISPETGAGTDNIVVLINEPHGGLKPSERKPRSKKYADDDDDRRSKKKKSNSSGSFGFWW